MSKDGQYGGTYWCDETSTMRTVEVDGVTFQLTDDLGISGSLESGFTLTIMGGGGDGICFDATMAGARFCFVPAIADGEGN